jgi:hypothetical protein
MISFFLASLPLLLSNDPTALDGLRTEFVPADARLVLHFDMQGIQRTQLWKAMSAPGGPVDELHSEDLQLFKTQFGIDPLTDLLSVTLWSASEDLEPEAAVLTTTASIDQALGILRMQPGYRTEVRDGVEIQFLTFDDVHDHGDDEEGTRIAVQVEGDSDEVAAYVHSLGSGQRAIVVAETPERVLRAAKVVRGESPSLASARSVAFQARPRPGSFLFGATVGGLPKTGNFQPASQIFGLAQGIQFDLGEAGGSFFVHAAITTADAELARKVRDSVAGLVAMGQLLVGTQPEVPQGVRDLLNAVQVTQSDNLVEVDFQYATAGLLDLMRTLDALDEQESGEDD